MHMIAKHLFAKPIFLSKVNTDIQDGCYYCVFAPFYSRALSEEVYWLTRNVHLWPVAGYESYGSFLDTR